MLQTLKVVAFRNPFVFHSIMKSTHSAIKHQHTTYSGKAFYTVKARVQDSAETEKMILDYYLRKQDNADLYYVGKKVTLILQELLQLRPKEAIDIVARHKKFLHTPWAVIEQNHRLCLDNGIERKYLLSFPEILTEEKLNDKIQILKEYSNNDLNAMLPLMKLPLKSVEKIASNPKWSQRVEDICRIFGVPKEKSCEMLATKPFMFKLKLETIRSSMKLLEEQGISKEEVKNDLWVLKYSPRLIQARLSYVNKVDCVPKTWMVRCKSDILENHIKRTSEKKDILGDSSVAEYLSERLSCSEEMAKYMFNKLPALESKSLTKINKMIDFLIENGFTSEQICRMPKILLHSVETTKKRMREVEAISTKKDYLYILTKSQKQYQQHLEALAKANGKKLT